MDCLPWIVLLGENNAQMVKKNNNMTQVEFMTLLCSQQPIGIIRASANATKCQAWSKRKKTRKEKEKKAPELPATPAQTS